MTTFSAIAGKAMGKGLEKWTKNKEPRALRQRGFLF